MIKGKNFNEFKQYNFLYIKNILDGIENFKHICFYGEYESYVNFIKFIIKDNKLTFFDFYFSKLKESEKQVFYNFSNYDNIINKFNIDEEEIYFSVNDIDDEILDFIIEISFKEILFTTFYFKEPSMTLWTNYNSQFVLFFEQDKFIQKYKELAQSLNLKILFENY